MCVGVFFLNTVYINPSGTALSSFLTMPLKFQQAFNAHIHKRIVSLYHALNI